MKARTGIVGLNVFCCQGLVEIYLSRISGSSNNNGVLISAWDSANLDSYFPIAGGWRGSMMRLIASKVSIDRMVLFAAWPYQEGHVEGFVCANLKFQSMMVQDGSSHARKFRS